MSGKGNNKKRGSRAVYLRKRYWSDVDRFREEARRKKRDWRKKYPEKAREEDRRKREKYSERRKEYSRNYQRTYKRDPLKVAARTILNNAIKLGKLKRPIRCEECKQKTKINAHHYDYTKPLEVAWLCVNCHALEHYPLPSPTANPN